MFAKQRGFNLLELLITVAVILVTLTVGVPSTLDILEKRRLSAATEEVFTMLHLARTEAIKRNRNLFISFHVDDDDHWCVGMSDVPDCDCSTANSCQLDGIERALNGDDYKNVRLTETFNAGSTGFDPRRGLALDSGSVLLAGDKHVTGIQVSALGRVRLCTPGGANDLMGTGPC